jgi:molybdopterin/thiamine biosynthesis adenylyltransferase|tara:strand:+ start:6253 stop:7056 length:804 start_codon:yes stop_codon:yes gene_type:complete
MLSDENLERYARQAIMPDIGEEGQEQLLAARVLVVGAGGLGSPAMLYLAAAGIGHITIIDPEQVELSNLNRQVLHTTSSIGTAKAQQAAAAVAALNPAIEVTALVERLDDGNAEALLTSHDVVVDCSDNVETRYQLGDASHRYGTPLVFGGAVRTEGQLAVFHSGGDDDGDGSDDGSAASSPCYRCVFPDMPDAQQAPGCSEAGILGPVTGVIGTMQALATIRLILGLGSTQTGKLMLFDGRGGGFMEISTSRRPQCVTCGTGATGS